MNGALPIRIDQVAAAIWARQLPCYSGHIAVYPISTPLPTSMHIYYTPLESHQKCELNEHTPIEIHPEMGELLRGHSAPSTCLIWMWIAELMGVADSMMSSAKRSQKSAQRAPEERPSIS